MLPGSMTRLVRSVFNRKSAVKVGAVAVVGLLALSGCSSRGVYDMPLPGGADVGNDPYDVKVRFSDVLDLVPNAGVRVNDVAVGRVSNINLAPGTWEAEVTVTLNGDVKLPANSIARLRQSSLLGEKYVEIAAPPQAPSGRLTDGATIGLNRSHRNPEVEEVLGALSLLLNGGGVAQLQDITKELNKAMSGRESDIRGLLDNLDELVTGLDAQRNDIVRALDSINRLSAKLNEQRGSIDTALRDLGPGLQVLNEQRGQLVTMLQSLDKLSGTATRTIDASREDLVADLNALAPTLQQLAKTGTDLPKAMAFLSTYPFPEYAMVPLKGDFVNTNVFIDLDLSALYENFARSSGPPIPIPGISDSGQSGANIPLPPGSPQLPPLPIPGTQPDGGLLPGPPGGGS